MDSTDNELRNLYTDFASKHNTLVDRVLRGTEHVDAGTQHVDAGIDLFCPDKLIMAGRQTGKVDHCVKAAMEFMANNAVPCGLPVGYYLYPRSSTGTKTPLRLANSVGIIDSGYRGELMAVVDNINAANGDMKVYINQHMPPMSRMFQICSPTLQPFMVQLVESEEMLGKSERGSGGFGSTGV